MVYTKGNLIETTDYNEFVGTPTGTPSNANKALQPFISDAEATLRVAGIYGVGNGQRGYGQADVTLPNVATPELVGSTEWTALRTAIENAANHQGTSTALLPPAAQMEVGDIITAHDGITDTFNLPQMIINIDNVANRFNISSSSVTTGGVATRGSTWTASITLVITATFASEDEARFFFNSGGSLRLDLDHPTGSAQDNSWNTILNNYVGTIDLNYTETTRTGSKGSAVALGFYDLTGSNQQIYNGTNIGDLPYQTNDVFISARATGIAGVNGGNGVAVEFTVLLQDQHTGPADTVSAGTSCTPASVKSTVLSITAPSWSNTGWTGS